MPQLPGDKLFQWCFISSVVLSIVIPSLSQETFSSITHLRALLRNEHILLEGMEEYINNEEQRLQELRSVLEKRQKELRDGKVEDDIYDVDHPIKAYQLIKRWFQLTGAATRVDNLNALQRKLNVHGAPLLGVADALGSAAAIIRLQMVYNLTTDDLALGQVLGEPAPRLDGADMYQLGQICMKLGAYSLASQWFIKCLETNQSHYPVADAIYQLAKANYWIGDYEEALIHIRRAYLREPNNSTYLADLNLYTSQNETLYKHNNGVPHKTAQTWVRYQPDWKSNYEKLCRKEQIQEDQNILKKAHCRYRRTRIPYYMVKEEVLSVDPWIAQFYDVIYDREIEIIKALATPELDRAQVGDPAKAIATDERVSKVAWLWDNNPNPMIDALSKRVALITGLTTQYRPVLSSAEPFQVINYGMAGQYEPHLDFYEDDALLANVPTHLRNTGRRICTYMYYLSDIKAGGATVFPLAKVYVPPVKGAAAFWFNIKKNGEMDRRTQHAGCPVLMGEKWVANKWIREYGQEFRRRCGLKWNSVEDGY